MRSKNLSTAGAAFLALASLTACSIEAYHAPSPAPEAAATGLPDRDPALARKLVSEGALLVDVRTPAEYAGGHVDGAVNVPIDELDARLVEIDKLTSSDKNKPIVVYCQSGGRAGRAKDKLVKAGHPRVTNLGGVGDWDKK